MKKNLLIIFTILIFAGLGFTSETKAAICDTDTNSCSGADCSSCPPVSVTLSWQAFTQSDLNAIHPGYTLQTVSYTVGGTVGSKTTSGTSTSFSGLTKSTDYTWWVVTNYTYSGRSGSAETSTYSFKTPAYNPPIANAGPDKEVFEGQQVVLEGSGYVPTPAPTSTPIPNVCAGVPNNGQVAGCNGLCQACQNGTCGVANAGTDPGNQCGTTGCYTGNCKGGTAVCGYYTSGYGNCSTCQGCAGATSGSCVPITGYNEGPNCAATCKGCSAGSCINIPLGSKDNNGVNTCITQFYVCDGAGNCTAPSTCIACDYYYNCKDTCAYGGYSYCVGGWGNGIGCQGDWPFWCDSPCKQQYLPVCQCYIYW